MPSYFHKALYGPVRYAEAFYTSKQTIRKHGLMNGVKQLNLPMPPENTIITNYNSIWKKDGHETSLAYQVMPKTFDKKQGNK